VGLPGEFSREWAYTSLSRAKKPTRVYVVSGHTQAEEERKEYARVMDAELDREKVIARLAARMDTRDLEEAALLQRARDGRLDLGAGDELDAEAEGELQVDIERYRDGCYQLAREAFHRMQQGEPVGGPRLDAYIDLLAQCQIVQRTFDSEQLQGALQAARDGQRAEKMLDQLQEQAASGELNSGQRQSMETLVIARGDVLSRYPDPQGILNMKAKHDQALNTLERETVRARAAAVSEHIAAQPGWVTVIGTRPAGRRLREAWSEVLEDLAGRYVDARAQRELASERAVEANRGAEAPRPARQAVSDPLVRARAEAKARFEALMADPDNPSLLSASVEAQRTAEQVELDSKPRWLTGTLGERPADRKLAKEWDRLGRRIINLRDSHGITDPLDNAYNHADLSLRRSIGRYRINAGLDQPPPGMDISRGYGIGD